MNRERVKTALRAFAYFYIDTYNKQHSHVKRKINTMKQLREKYMILKPDKDNWVMLMNKVDYHEWNNYFLTKRNN